MRPFARKRSNTNARAGRLREQELEFIFIQAMELHAQAWPARSCRRANGAFFYRTPNASPATFLREAANSMKSKDCMMTFDVPSRDAPCTMHELRRGECNVQFRVAPHTSSIFHRSTHHQRVVKKPRIRHSTCDSISGHVDPPCPDQTQTIPTMKNQLNALLALTGLFACATLSSCTTNVTPAPATTGTATSTTTQSTYPYSGNSTTVKRTTTTQY